MARRPLPTFAALDFETANQDRSSVCAIGLVRVEQGAIVARASKLVRPPTQDFFFRSVHGLSASDVAHAPGFGEVWRQLAHLLRDVEFIAAHNAGFERSVVDACARRFGIATPRVRFECTVALARTTWGLRPTKLPDVARFLGLPLRHHDPLSDAEACAKIVLAAHEADRGWPRLPGL